MYFIYFLFICLIIAFTVALITCLARINTHKCKRKKYEQIINENLKSKDLRDFFLILCERSYDYIKVFFIFQGIAKTTNGLSLLFTVSGLVLTASDSFIGEAKWLSSKGWGVLVSVISIIFVCIIIYINPTKRANQYLQCWRNTDKNIIQLLASLQNGSEEETKGFVSNYKELQEFAMICAKDLSDGEFKITSDEE